MPIQAIGSSYVHVPACIHVSRCVCAFKRVGFARSGCRRPSREGLWCKAHLAQGWYRECSAKGPVRSQQQQIRLFLASLRIWSTFLLLPRVPPPPQPTIHCSLPPALLTLHILGCKPFPGKASCPMGVARVNGSVCGTSRPFADASVPV